jgi:thiol-disulfide isomerase/thioredoxin
MFLKAALITIGVAITFLYVIGRLGGNQRPEPVEKETAGTAPEAASAECDASAKIAGAVESLARGEVAAMAISKAPQKLPDYSFDGPDGQRTSLAAFAGKTVLFNLWATWCVPCRAEMPALDKLQAELGSDKFQVVAVNIDTTRLDKPRAFLQEVGVKSLTYYSDSKADVFQELKASGKALGLPATLLVGPDGCQIGALNGPAVWDSADAKTLIADAVAAALR